MAFFEEHQNIEGLIVGVMTEIDKMETAVIRTEDKIESIEAEVAAVLAQIESLSEKSGLEANRLHAKEAQLRDEKAQLRDEKAQLRDEKAQLRAKEAQLRDEKAQLRAKEAQEMLLLKDFGTLKVGSGAGGGKGANVYIATPVNQGSASSFVSSAQMKKAILGFGFLPSSCRVDPTGDQRVSRRLIPSLREVAEETLVLACMGENATLMARGEDETFGVRVAFEDIAKALPPLTSSGSSLESYGSLGHGIATNASKPDFVWMAKSRVVGFLEVKDTTASTLVALRQATITAMSIVSDLRSQGLPTEQIVLPVAGCTGTMIQFGAVICIEDSFGTFLATSAILDLNDMKQNLLAAAYLRKASACARETEQLLSTLSVGTSRKPESMKLDTSKYWIKYLTEEVFGRGLGLFTDGNTSHFDVGFGLEHMGRALNLLYQHEAAREVVAFPLSVRSPNCLKANAPDSDCYFIIYEDLSKLGYRIGTPNRLEDEGLYQRFLVALRCAVEKVHSAGVLHCDLYPSNFMWRCEADASSGTDTEARISIKIIDWDCAHCLAEGAFCPRITNALMQHMPTRSALFGVQHDLRYVEVLEATRNDNETDEKLWGALASNNKSVVDHAFYELFSRE